MGLDFSPHVLQARCPDNTSSSGGGCGQAGGAADDPSSGAVVGPLSDEEVKEVQRGVFQQQIRLANELGLPLNVHSRSAGHHAVSGPETSGALGLGCPAEVAQGVRAHSRVCML